MTAYYPKIYLCGPIAGCTDEQCKDWRNWFKENYPGECLDPMRRDYRGKDTAQYAGEIVEGDKIDIDNVDAVVVNCGDPSWGTAMEILYAYEASKPVILVTPRKRNELSPWLVYHSRIVLPSFETAIELLTKIANGEGLVLL